MKLSRELHTHGYLEVFQLLVGHDGPLLLPVDIAVGQHIVVQHLFLLCLRLHLPLLFHGAGPEDQHRLALAVCDGVDVEMTAPARWECEEGLEKRECTRDAGESATTSAASALPQVR